MDLDTEKKKSINFTVSSGDVFILKHLTNGEDLHITQIHLHGMQNSLKLIKMKISSATLKLCSVATGQWKQAIRHTPIHAIWSDQCHRISVITLTHS